ncbi:Na-translocating system protein MpsC family protein [Niallia sp. Krafla_26]|uniref:Na-translocating system protein MpsC family protein n=1 Tax=Niallia sp. Krafla_26 TaxID=3064703 RepID=UPI003D1817D2
MVVVQEDLLAVNSSFSKIIKRGIGKGPENCYTVLNANQLYVYIRNFMTPAEEILMNQKEYNLVMKYRSAVISALSNELLKDASQLLEISFDSMYQDWNFHTNSGVLLLVNNRPHPDIKLDENFNRKLFQLIRMVGSQFHKTPSEFKVIKYTENSCAIESKEIMFPLERLLIKKGNEDLLLTHTREIKKGYIQHKRLFEDLFNRSIEDIYMMWDCNQSKHYLIFSFKRPTP